jgi:nitrilase
MQYHQRASCPSLSVKEFAMKVVKAAAVQISPVLYSREATVGKVVKKILELGEKGVQFATFLKPWCLTTRTFPPSRPAFSFSPEPNICDCSNSP